MSKRKALVLIGLTWTVAVILGVLPWVWPWYQHLIGTRIYQDYEGEAVAFLAGYLTNDYLGRRRVRRAGWPWRARR